MLASATKRSLVRFPRWVAVFSDVHNPNTRTSSWRSHSSSAQTYEVPQFQYALNENGDVPSPCNNNTKKEEVIQFPAVDRSSPDFNAETTPILLNANEHVVGYLSKILNARVYDAAIETELQHAKNLSTVR
jgi:hypothetical protein